MTLTVVFTLGMGELLFTHRSEEPKEEVRYGKRKRIAKIYLYQAEPDSLGFR